MSASWLPVAAAIPIGLAAAILAEAKTHSKRVFLATYLLVFTVVYLVVGVITGVV